LSYKTKGDKVILYRNSIEELILHTKNTKVLTSWLKDTMRKDYFEYLKFYGIKEPVHLYTWFMNVIKLDLSIKSLISKIEIADNEFSRS